MNPRGLRAAIIDLDGTLVHTLPDFAHAINGMLFELGLPAVADEVVGLHIGKGSAHLIESVLRLVLSPAGGRSDAQQAPGLVSAAMLKTAEQSYQTHYASINGRFASVYEGVHEGLHSLQKRGWPLACLTNKPLAFAQDLLRQKGLDGYFSQLFGGDSFERKKPDPLPLLKTCIALGTLPAQTLMLGDSSNDAQAARAAGCPVLLVSYGYNHGQPASETDADGVLGTLAEVEGWLAPVPSAAGA